MKDLTILIGMPCFGYDIPTTTIIKDRLRELGISAKVNMNGLFLITFRNNQDLHLFMISGVVEACDTYEGYRTYTWLRR
jgi:hypothetical protein